MALSQPIIIVKWSIFCPKQKSLQLSAGLLFPFTPPTGSEILRCWLYLSLVVLKNLPFLFIKQAPPTHSGFCSSKLPIVEVARFLHHLPLPNLWRSPQHREIVFFNSVNAKFHCQTPKKNHHNETLFLCNRWPLSTLGLGHLMNVYIESHCLKDGGSAHDARFTKR